MIINGRALAAGILAQAKALSGGRALTVRAIVIAPTSATESYLSIKERRANDAGMMLEVVRLPENADAEAVREAVTAPGADAVIIQLPIPDALYDGGILDAIPQSKDADVLSSAAYSAFENDAPGALTPPVADAVREILISAKVSLAGKKTVVVGKGKLVGKPVLTLLSRMGAQVTVVDIGTEHKEAIYKDADIIVSGAGVAGLITPAMVKEGAVLLDAGTSGTGGTVAGDFDPACAQKASVFTPVPGGVGPVAVACLFRNAAKLGAV